MVVSMVVGDCARSVGPALSTGFEVCVRLAFRAKRMASRNRGVAGESVVIDVQPVFVGNMVAKEEGAP
jgi:hypothetical protein